MVSFFVVCPIICPVQLRDKAKILFTTVLSVCVLSFYSLWTSDLWTYQPGSHRRKVTQDISAFDLGAYLNFSRVEHLAIFSLVDRKVQLCVRTQEVIILRFLSMTF